MVVVWAQCNGGEMSENAVALSPSKRRMKQLTQKLTGLQDQLVSGKLVRVGFMPGVCCLH